jgi:hypothetical protein
VKSGNRIEQITDEDLLMVSETPMAELQKLTHAEKLRVVQMLVNQLAQEEAVSRRRNMRSGCLTTPPARKPITGADPL